MRYTPEQRAILEHPAGSHAVVRAVPGSGKTTTLVGRVLRLCEEGTAPGRIRVVMFNKSIQRSFEQRLQDAEISGVRVTTFDAMGHELLRIADRRGLLSGPLEFVPDGTTAWAREVFRASLTVREALEGPEEIADAVAFWKAQLIPPARAACPERPALLRAYHEVEALRCAGGVLRVAFEDLVYTAAAVARRYPRLLGEVDHLLIDEFQDVNPGRVTLCQGIVHPGTSILAVGDEDQGINEWCGAHPRFFREFAESFPGLPTRVYPLSRSFRFGPTIAAAANSVIRNNTQRQALASVGGGATPGEVTKIDDVAAAVQGLLDAGRSAQDIAVLYRGRGQGVGALAALAAVGGPVRTEDLDLFRRGRGPELALAYLRLATSAAPVGLEEAWLVVFAPDRFIQKQAFTAQLQQRGCKGLVATLRDAKLAARLGQNSGGIESMVALGGLLARMARCDSAGDALDLLSAEVDVAAQLRARIRSVPQQELAIAAFDGVHSLLRGLEVAPADAATALAELDMQQGEPAERCVWASTIHKAKGMEWPCVVLPGLVEGACPSEQRGVVPGSREHPEGVPQSPWDEQERRIFYVGLTRAAQQVLLHAPPSDPSRFVSEALPPPPAVQLRKRSAIEGTGKRASAK